MDEVTIIQQSSGGRGNNHKDKFELQVRAVNRRAAKIKARAYVRRHSLVTPAIPDVGEPVFVKESRSRFSPRKVYQVSASILVG